MALKDLSVIERKIITRFLDNVAELHRKSDGDFRIRVSDGEDISFAGSEGAFDREGIEAIIGITAYTKIQVKVGAASHATLFVHGNDEDVVSDVAFNKLGEALEAELLKGLDDEY